MFTLSSSSKNTLHQIQTLNSENKNNNHHHDAIFSPYLTNKEGNFILKLGESSQIINPFINPTKSPLSQVEKTEDSGEIGVFGAEKYFNRREVETSRAATKYLPQRDEKMAIETRKYKVDEYGTSSIGSVSTWNSQNALLKSGLRNSNKEKVQANKSVLYNLGFKCSCSDKNSVDINDHEGKISFRNYGAVHSKTKPKKIFNLGLDDVSVKKISKPSSEIFINNNKDVYFQKNSLACNTRNHLVKMQSPLDEENTPRKSLEVFGSPKPILNSKRSSLSIDKRLVFPKMVEEIDSNYDVDDAASDASSDLFEIESIKGKSHTTFLTRQTSDATSSCVSPNCYAPSEASIEWSVVTASIDCEDQMSEFTIRTPIRTPLNSSNGKTKVSREIPRRRPGILLGCKSHKAVKVVGDAFITYEKSSLSPNIANRNNINSMVARFPGETNLAAKRHG
ncbi:protein PHYTOCHROME KINASE SUBSTRATE 1 [Cicer arietinum]|uniref:Protein PHYTOCHROME KINASE SUBSTRATE 1 n=1 Tax=Cicer arietinum TaxID=3827 RepID=A0A1S2YWU4_CICAR|nr:protein PHYTOCHROME KINASE SUBSTRATE 1 [Cicer arietinum]